MTTVILQELSQREGLTNQLQQPNNKMALYKYKYENSHRNIELYWMFTGTFTMKWLYEICTGTFTMFICKNLQNDT